MKCCRIVALSMTLLVAIAGGAFAQRGFTWAAGPVGGGWYAISTEDRTISPELERFMADRMKAKTIEVKASHLSLISHPHEITNLILNAAGHSG